MQYKFIDIEKLNLPPKGDVIDWLEKNPDATAEDVLSLPTKEHASNQNKQHEMTEDEQEEEDDKKQREKQVTLILNATKGWEKFHDMDGENYITVPIKGIKQTYRLTSKSKRVKGLLIGDFYRRWGTSPSQNAITDAISTLEAQAEHDGKEHQVFIRVGQKDNKNYLDLCNDKWEVVEQTKDGWKVISDSPVKFIRTQAMRALPHPVQNGSLDGLRKLFSGTYAQFVLLVAILIACLRPTGPFPLLCLQGEQGSGKSLLCEFIKSLIDPSQTPRQTLCENEDNLLITCKNSWVPCFDNISGMKPATSDALCRLSTGGGQSKRVLFSDDDVIVFDLSRCIILNGITTITTRPDLMDRAIIIPLPVIPPDERRDERIMRQEFQAITPAVLCKLLDGACSSLKNIDAVELEETPRMADFAKWVIASEEGLGWEKNSFLPIYNENIEENASDSLNEDMLGSVLSEFLNLQEVTPEGLIWEGTSRSLLNELSEQAGDKIASSKYWPKAPHAITKYVKRYAPSFRHSGINIEYDSKRTNKGTIIVITKMAKKATKKNDEPRFEEPLPPSSGDYDYEF